jgi:hypothetical protein
MHQVTPATTFAVPGDLKLLFLNDERKEDRIMELEESSGIRMFHALH